MQAVSPSVYPMTPNLVDWLSHHLELVEEATFVYYRAIIRLVEIVDACERGEIPRRTAEAAIRRYNDVNKLNLQGRELVYEDIAGRVSTFLFSDAGQKWAVYTENPQRLIAGPHDEPELCFYEADPDISWALLWLVGEKTLIVYRSPHKGYRDRMDCETEHLDLNLCDGLSGGDCPSFTLPPSIEGAIRQDQRM